MGVNLLLSEDEILIARSANSRFVQWLVTFMQQNVKDKAALAEEHELIVETMKTWWKQRQWRWFLEASSADEILFEQDDVLHKDLTKLATAYQAGDLSTAASLYYEMAVDQFHDGTDDYYLQFGLDRLAEVWELFHEAIKIRPHNVEIRYNLIGLMYQSNQYVLYDLFREIQDLLKIDRNEAETFSRKPEQCYDYAINVAMKHRLIAMGGQSLVEGYRPYHDYSFNDFKDLLESGDAAKILTMYRKGDYNERFEAGEMLQHMGIDPNDPLDFMDNFIENENIRREINKKRKSSGFKNRGNVGPKIIIYTMFNCDYSLQAKQYLNLHGYEFEERKLEDGKAWLREMLAISGNFAGTPVISIDRADGTSKVIKGFTEDKLDAAIYEEDLFFCRSSGDKPGEADSLYELGNAHVRLSEYPEARARYEESLPIFRTLGDRPREANILGALGNVYAHLSEYSEACARYEKAIPIFRALGDRPREANILGALGMVHYLLSEFSESRNRSQQALSIYRTLGDKPGEATSLEFLGDVYSALSEFPEARNRYEEALLVYRAIGDPGSEANCILSLGDVNLWLSEYPEARARYEAALLIFRSLADQIGEANSLQRLGNMAAKEQDFDLAQKYYEDSILIFKEISPADAAIGYNSLGSLYVEQKEYTKAIQAFSRSLKLSPENAYVLRNRAGEYIRLKQVESAAADLERAANLEPDHPYLFLRRGDLAILQGNYPEAVNHLSKAIAYDPHMAEAYFSIGLAYLYLAKIEEASSFYQKGLAVSAQISNNDDTLIDDTLAGLEPLKARTDIQKAVEDIWISIQEWKISKTNSTQKQLR